MTVHGSKGLEFRATHIGYIDDDSYGANAPTWDVDDSIVPLVPPHVLGSSATEHAFETAVERNNLFYVALSRARERLQIYENLEFSSKVRLRQLANNPRNYIKKSVKNQAPKIAMGNGATVPTKNLTVKLDEFEAYIRCPLQHHYRFGLQLSHEREIDMVLRARWVISETLEEYARNKTAPKQVFGDAWERYELPNEEADRQFITDAKKVCRRGLTRIAELNGSFIEKNISKLGGLSVELPWLLETRTRSESRLHLIRFSSRGVSSTISYLRPLIGEISGRRPTPMEIHTLLEEKTFEVKISQRPESTTAYKAAGKMCANQIISAPGRQCAKCAYITICPTRAQ